METRLVKSISMQIYRRFPEVKGCTPKVRLQSSAQPKSIASSRYLLTFNGKAESPNGKLIPRVVRVIANADGKIIKITTSR